MGAMMTLHQELSKHIDSLQSRVYKLQTELDSRQNRIRQNSTKFPGKVQNLCLVICTQVCTRNRKRLVFIKCIVKIGTI